MNATIELPLWLGIALIALTGLWLWQHFILPSARWYMRRRANRVIHEVNERLALRLPSFKLTRREVLIDRLAWHPRVLEQVDSMAAEKGLPREVLMRDVQAYAREIVPAFNALLYFKGAYWFARKTVHALYRVRLGFADDEALGKLDENTSVVFVMNHRSNMDYILATYLAVEKTALSYAVGEWARIWPLQQLIRAMGGYFVRRDSGDPLYRRVLESYVQMAAEGGVPQAVFPEGRLSRDGKLGAAKMGLLGYLVRGFEPSGGRDIVFIPVGINYDRVIEDRSLLRYKKRLPRRGMFYSAATSLRYVGKQFVFALLGKRYKNGYACVNFGKPISLRTWIEENQPDHDLEDVTLLANYLMNCIGSITPLLPVALVATIFVNNQQRSYSELELKNAVFELLQRLEAAGYRAYIPRADRDYSVTVGVRMLTLRHILHEDNGVYKLDEKELELLQYYANSIEHLVDTLSPTPADTNLINPTTLSNEK
ncbi:MAG: 1-acyl-sn-glycerol-3-phosphate acyltransferase [Granulosicoccaceae bacterium]